MKRKSVNNLLSWVKKKSDHVDSNDLVGREQEAVEKSSEQDVVLPSTSDKKSDDVNNSMDTIGIEDKTPANAQEVSLIDSQQDVTSKHNLT